jgi:predicted ATP-grasp superfamily ATP-dependent carboligase
MDKKAILVFSGYNFRAVIAFCRFARTNGIRFHIVACGKDDPVWLTDLASDVVITRHDHQLNAENFISLCIGVKASEELDQIDVLPSSEYLNRFLLRYRLEFASHGISVPLCDEAIYQTLSDKLSFAKLCRIHGLDTPRNLRPEEISTYPVVIKPNEYFKRDGSVQFKPLIVPDRDTHQHLLRGLNIQEVHHQEFVQGSSHYLLFYVSKCGNHVVFSQQNLIQQSHGGSIVAARASVLHQTPIADAYLQFLIHIGFYGLIMIELRSMEGRHVMIEANPRLWGPSQLFVDLNVPIFTRFVEELGYTPRTVTVTNHQHPECYFWNAGFVRDRRSGNTPAFHQYSPDEFVNDYAIWQNSDVYLRPDSLNLYKNEICHD